MASLREEHPEYEYMQTELKFYWARDVGLPHKPLPFLL